MKLALWNRYHCMTLLAASLVVLLSRSFLFFLVIALVSILLLFRISKDELIALKPFGGWANRVTAIRFLAIGILAVIYPNLSNLQIALWLGIILPLDGLDGYLARTRNERTSMGAYFDMETDVLFVYIASCILLFRRLTGYEIILPALLRYFYVFIVYVCGLHHVKEQRTKIGPVIAVYVFVSVTLAFIISEPYRRILIYSAILLLVLSFSYSFILLVKQRKLKIKAG